MESILKDFATMMRQLNLMNHPEDDILALSKLLVQVAQRGFPEYKITYDKLKKIFGIDEPVMISRIISTIHPQHQGNANTQQQQGESQPGQEQQPAGQRDERGYLKSPYRQSGHTVIPKPQP